jgi:hypothetical protein
MDKSNSLEKLALAQNMLRGKHGERIMESLQNNLTITHLSL